jgi:putative DNA primase/helicase
MCTDYGNAERLVARFGDRLRWCQAWGRWLVWTGKRWLADHTGAAERLAKRTVRAMYDEAARVRESDRADAAEMAQHLASWAAKSEGSDRLSAMLRVARSETGIAVMPQQLDADHWLFNLDNGTIDLRTGELRHHDRDDLITKLVSIEYDPSATCPRYDAFLHQILREDEEVEEYLDRFFASCLTGDRSSHDLPVFWGVGANGKSTLVDLMLYILGEYAGPVPESLLVSRSGNEHPTELADLCGKRLIVASENDEGHTMPVGLVKRLTGDQKLKGRYMRQDFFEFEQTHKVILVTNNRPRITEDSDAIWRRLKLIEFGVCIPREQRDRNLLQRLQAEAPGILARLIRACLRWQADGHDLTEPTSIQESTAEYRQDEDPLTDFLQNKCIREPNAQCVRDEIFDAYQSWAQANGIRYPLGKRSFFERLRKIEGVEEGQQRIGQKHRKRVFYGIAPLDHLATMPG